MSVIAARTQTAGRGQGDHSWFSTPSTNLTFSMLYRFGEGFPVSVDAVDTVTVTRITTLGIHDFLKGKGIDSRIKWPNDIWCGERKICGILIENILVRSEVRASIVGIGLNVNQKEWPAELPNPVSMTQLTGKVYSLEELLPELRDCITNRYVLASAPQGLKILEKEFDALVFRLPSKP